MFICPYSFFLGFVENWFYFSTLSCCLKRSNIFPIKTAYLVEKNSTKNKKISFESFPRGTIIGGYSKCSCNTSIKLLKCKNTTFSLFDIWIDKTSSNKNSFLIKICLTSIPTSFCQVIRSIRTTFLCSYCSSPRG